MHFQIKSTLKNNRNILLNMFLNFYYFHEQTQAIYHSIQNIFENSYLNNIL
jgi:hypothetical protein